MKKNILITGASRGIGLALAQLYLKKDYSVWGTSRTGTINEIKDTNFEVLTLDLANMNEIRAVDEHLNRKKIKLDILINNAGIGPDLNTLLPEPSSFQQTFQVNVTGTVFFTESMIKHLNIGGQIIHISSKMGSIELCQSTDSVAYRMSKTALNMYTKVLTNRLLGKQKVAAVHPGWVRTSISPSNINGRLSTEESAQKIYDFSKGDYKTGIFWDVETQGECEW